MSSKWVQVGTLCGLLWCLLQNTYDKLYKEVPTYKLITPSIVSERLKVRGSLARKALIELTEKGIIQKVTVCLFNIFGVLPLYM